MLTFSLGVFSYLLAFIARMTFDGIVMYWYNSTFIVIPHDENLFATFSFSVIFSFVAALIYIVFMLDSRKQSYLWIWFSLMIIVIILSIVSTSPLSMNAWMNKWDNQWTNKSHTMSFQIELKCCGWEDFLDRSIECPFSYRSGCKNIVSAWINERLGEVFKVYCLLGAMELYCIIMTFILFFHKKTESMWTELELPIFNYRIP